MPDAEIVQQQSFGKFWAGKSINKTLACVTFSWDTIGVKMTSFLDLNH
jgi:hypothetical protein